MTSSTTSAAFERALTLGGKGRHGELSEVTRGIYAHWYARAAAWKRSEVGSSVRTFTPEQVAQYALWLVEQGYARSTAGLAVRAIRWFHRVAGEPVPDGLPAYVLLSGHSTPADHEAVNDLDAPASRDPLDLLAAMTAVCRPREPKGRRDLAMINLVYAGGFNAEQLAALNMGDAYETGRLDHLPHHDGLGCYPSMCARCSVLAWYNLLVGRLGTWNTTDPLFRPVDKGGNVAGTDDPYAGQHAGTGRLAHTSISRKILRPLAVEAGLHLDSPVRALRLAGASADYIAGVITLDDAARRAGYTPRSALMLRHLLDLTAPVRREDAP
jgi:hypothetical protein